MTVKKNNQNLRLGKYVKKITRKTIFISGNSRSGTTIAGKIIGSCKNCEYFFEPELLFSLFSIINKIPKKEWMLIFETYIIEDLLIKSALGRSVNMRPQDDSFFLNTKNIKEYNHRIKQKGTKSNALNLINNKIPIIKIPDVTVFLKKFQNYYPTIKIVICKRNNKNMFKSIKVKKWYAKPTLQGLTWPFIKYLNSEIPFFIKRNKFTKWINFNEDEKINECIKANIPCKILNYYTFNYDRLINNKKQVLKFLKKLKILPSNITLKNINSFRQKR